MYPIGTDIGTYRVDCMLLTGAGAKGSMSTRTRHEPSKGHGKSRFFSPCEHGDALGCIALLMEAVEGRGRRVSRIWKDEMTLMERAAAQLGSELGTSAKEDTTPPVPRPHLNSGRRRGRSAEGDPEVVKMVLGNAKDGAGQDGAGQDAHADPSRIFLGEMSLQERALAQLKKSDKGKLATPSASSSGVPHGTDSDAATVTFTDATTVDIFAADSSASGEEEEEREPEPAVVEQARAMMRDLPYVDWRNGEEEGEEDGSDCTDPVQRMLDVMKLHLKNENERLRQVNDEDTDTLANDPRYDTEMRARAWSSGSSRRLTSMLNAHEAKVAASLDEGVEGLQRSLHKQAQSVAPRTPRGALPVGLIKSGAMVRSSDLPLSQRLGEARAATDTLEQRWRNQGGWTYQAAWRGSPTLEQVARTSESPRVPRSELARRAQSEATGSSPLHRALASPRAAADSPSWRQAARALTPAGVASPGRRASDQSRDASRGRLERTPSRGY